MLSKNVRPGTRVVGIREPALESMVREDYLESARKIGVLGEHEGWYFTVRRVVPCQAAVIGFAVIFDELDDGLWPLECYRVLELPSCLTDLLVSVPRDLVVTA